MKNNSNEENAHRIICENDVDIALFAEYKGTHISKVIAMLNNQYDWHDGIGGCDTITLLCKSSINVTINREHSRYTIYLCELDAKKYNIVGLHLPAEPYSDEETRKNHIRALQMDISEQEKKSGTSNTIVIGDFNCNPYSKEMVQKDTFNAVLFKKLVKHKEYDEFCGNMYRRFYNPTLLFLSEEKEMYGSYYYSSGSAPMYWNCLDQVLVRKPLIDEIIDISFIKYIHGRSLIKKICPDTSVSDHLPLLVEMV